MRLAFIDVGTNSVRLDVYQMYEDGTYARLQRKKVMVRLGQGVYVENKLCRDGIKRTLAVLSDYRHVCDELCVERIKATATSALRTASNAPKFIAQVQKELGIDLEVISGKQEAELILAGIRNDERIQERVFGFVDIGGGSTEVGVVDGDKVLFLDSLPLGSARIAQMFFREKKNGQSVREARTHIIKVFSKLVPDNLPEIPQMFGSSGTVKAIQRMLEGAGRGEKIRVKNLSDLIGELSELSLEEKKLYPGLNPKRADIIVPGALILQEAMIYLKTSQLSFSKFALRDGLLAEEIASKQYSQARGRLKRLK